jgi:hypothetical protein
MSFGMTAALVELRIADRRREAARRRTPRARRRSPAPGRDEEAPGLRIRIGVRLVEAGLHLLATPRSSPGGGSSSLGARFSRSV